MADTDFQRKGSEVEVESLLISSTLTVLSSAIDLYQRGLNVFPIMRPEMIRELSMQYPAHYSVGEKRPYVLQPLFTSRMHLCDEFCFEQERKTSRICPGCKPGINFQDSFLGSNLGVIVGRTSENLVCIDCDSVHAFNGVYQQFTNRNLEFWAFQTSRGGNFLFQIEEHEIRNQLKSLLNEVEIWGSNHFCVLPPSVHDSGVIYTWLRDQNPFSGKWIDGMVPRLSIRTLDWLGIGDQYHRISDPNFDNVPTWTRMLSIPNQKILTGTLKQGTRNSQLVNPAYEIAALIKNGLVSEADGLEVLIQTGTKALPPYPENKVRQMLKSALKKNDLTTTREFYGDDRVVALWDQASNFASSYDWGSHGRTALTDMAVFRACCERCRMDRGQPFRASVREICELANIASIKTASIAMRRLQKKGLIEFSQKTNGGANCYIFGQVVDYGNDYINTTCNTSVVATKHKKSIDIDRLELLDDIFGRIGRVSRICWEHLIDHPEASISQLSQNIGLNYHSIYYNIPRLLSLGLISKSTAEGLYIGEDLSDRELVEVAKGLDVLGKSRIRRRNHEIEREIRVNLAIYHKKCEVKSQITNCSILGVISQHLSERNNNTETKNIKNMTKKEEKNG